MSFLSVDFVEAASTDVWYMNGRFQARIDALQISVENTNGIVSGGLVVDCWRNSGTMRVWVRDIVVANNQVVEYTTNKIRGSFRANKRFVAGPHPKLDRMGTLKLLRALRRGDSIKFTSKGSYTGEKQRDGIENSPVSVVYSLKGASKAIERLPLMCLRNYR